MSEALLIIVGLVILILGGELIVRGASRLALSLGLSPVVVGLTVVAFGTSSPELAVSLGAVSGGSPDVAVGNVVGSNIYNILLILGVAALIRPLLVQQRLVRFDVPLVIVVSLLLWVLVLDGSLSPLDGAVLFGALVLYLAITVRVGRRDGQTARDSGGDEAAPLVEPSTRRSRDLALFGLGLAALVVGSQLLVSGAASMARSMGVSELVVGLTVVAVGTSMPELVTSAMAAWRGHRDLAVGNVMGSNLFNILGILGLAALATPEGIAVAERVRTFDIPVMTVVAVACLPLLFTGYELRRWEGLLFVAYGLLYTAWVVLEATDHPLGSRFGDAMVWFVLPLTAVTIVSVLFREVVQRRRGPPPSRSG
ncbi:MAG: calcium/sodium antiporter [Candidatus Limnocylindrales bacterium]